ncbi:MAG: FmdB family transcriptional regulator [Nitrospira sp.]|nr:FmdB family transcriptional regulator [Nitrospira sp.]
MPTYEYQCDSCSNKFEAKQSMKDDPLSACPKCGQAVRRLISSPGIMFKGSGWYVTDYSSKLKPPSGETADSGSGSKKEAGTSATAPSSTTAPSTATPASSPSSNTSSSSGTPSSSGTSSSSS